MERNKTEDGIPGRVTAATVQGSEDLRGSMVSEGNSRASGSAWRVFTGAGMVSEGAGRASEARWKGLRGSCKESVESDLRSWGMS